MYASHIIFSYTKPALAYKPAHYNMEVNGAATICTHKKYALLYEGHIGTSRV